MLRASKVTVTGEFHEVIEMLKRRFPENADGWSHYDFQMRNFQQSLMARNLTPRITVEIDTAILTGTKEEIEWVKELEPHAVAQE